MTNKSDSAFPYVTPMGASTGLSKLEWISAMAMQGMIANCGSNLMFLAKEDGPSGVINNVSIVAIAFAEKLLAKLEEKKIT